MQNVIHDDVKDAWYYIPTIERSATKTTRPSVISLFTGAGGLDLGLEWAGFQTKGFVENNKYCIETIKRNRKDWPIVGNGDITKITGNEILAVANLSQGFPDLVVGGAPCQPFSSLGKNEGENTHNGQLYRHFIRLVNELQPKMFLFENVRGMMQNHKQVIGFMKEEFRKIRYKLATSLICAADYGVPQKRYRVFIIGRRDGKQPGFPFPTHSENPTKTLKHFKELFPKSGLENIKLDIKKWTTVGEAFSSITDEHYERDDSYTANLAPKIIEMIRYIQPDSKMCWRDLPHELKFECWKKGKFAGSDNFARLSYNEPAVTIRTGAIYPAKGKYIHPKENRGLNTIELAALQSFPLDIGGKNSWFFCGGITSVSRQIGNAVPPQLAKELGIALKNQIHEVE